MRSGKTEEPTVPNLRRIGQDAEDRVADYLLNKGYTIVTRRYQTKHGEIDIVALDGEILVFVEVKFRKQLNATPETAVDTIKTDRLAQTAERYAIEFGCLDKQTRFDLVAVTPRDIRHHVDAFRPR